MSLGSLGIDRFRLDGKVALVTGGSRGLGRAMAEALASAGADLVVTARDPAAATAVAADIARRYNRRAEGIAVDVTHPADVTAMVERTLEILGGLDILVNNAGINIRGPIEQLKEADWDSVLDTNLKAPWLCCRAVVPHMKSRRWGRIVNVSSMLGEVSLAERTPYASSKGGLNMLTRTLALELAPFGICVNALCPGPFATEINTPLLNDPQKRALMESRIPVGRWGEPAELGPSAIFLASDASSFMTGALLYVDGGYTAQ